MTGEDMKHLYFTLGTIFGVTSGLIKCPLSRPAFRTGGQSGKVLQLSTIIALSVFLFFCVCVAAQNPAQNYKPEISPQAKSESKPESKSENAPEIEMIFVKGGTFTMGCTAEQGSDCEDDEKPAHLVTLSDFYIGKYEVTQKQWSEITGTDIRRQRDNVNEGLPLRSFGDNYPMYYVSWYEAQDFIEKLNERTGKNFRLPTEAEWEYAARGGDQSRGYKYSGGNTLEEVAWYFENSGESGGKSNPVTHPVGTKKENELGIHDMSGNVWEWVNDLYGDYGADPQTNPQGPDTGWLYVLRGGSWYYHARLERVSLRGSSAPSNQGGHIGFRLAAPVVGEHN